MTTRALHNIRGTLKDADFSDIIAGRPEDEALDTLRIIAKALCAPFTHTPAPVPARLRCSLPPRHTDQPGGA